MLGRRSDSGRRSGVRYVYTLARVTHRRFSLPRFRRIAFDLLRAFGCGRFVGRRFEDAICAPLILPARLRFPPKSSSLMLRPDRYCNVSPLRVTTFGRTDGPTLFGAAS